MNKTELLTESLNHLQNCLANVTREAGSDLTDIDMSLGELDRSRNRISVVDGIPGYFLKFSFPFGSSSKTILGNRKKSYFCVAV